MFLDTLGNRLAGGHSDGVIAEGAYRRARVGNGSGKIIAKKNIIISNADNTPTLNNATTSGRPVVEVRPDEDVTLFPPYVN